MSASLSRGPVEPTSGRAGRRFRIPAALHHRNFALYWCAQIVSMMGTFMQTVALGYFVYTTTHSKALLGVITAVQLGPSLVLGLPAGVLADRVIKRRLILTTQTTAAGLALTLATLTALHALQVWEIVVIMSFSGLAIAIEGPTRQSFIVDMVGREDLPAAIGLNSISVSLARIVGPAIGGLAVGAFGVAAVFYYNAVSFLAVITALLLMRNLPRRSSVAHRHPLRQLQDGLVYIGRTPFLFLTFSIVAAVGIFGLNFTVLMPILARDTLHTSASGLGWMWAALAVGAVAGNTTVIRWSRQARSGALIIPAAVALGSFEIGMGLTRSFPLVLLFLMCVGWGEGAFFAGANTAIQSGVPDEIRGRVVSVYTTIFIGTTPIGAVFASAVATAGGAGLAVATGGAISLLSALALGPRMIRATRAVPIVDQDLVDHGSPVNEDATVELEGALPELQAD